MKLWFSNFCLKDVKKSCICIKAIIIHGRNDYTLHYTKFRKKEIWHHDLSDLTYLAGNSESERNCFFLLAWRIVIFNVQSRGGGGGYFLLIPIKRLLGMCCWMGSHFHNWTDYNGVTFLVELLEWGRKFLGFLGQENSGEQGFKNRKISG